MGFEKCNLLQETRILELRLKIMIMNWSKKQIQSFKKLNPKNVSDAKLCKDRITAGLVWGECYCSTLLHF